MMKKLTLTIYFCFIFLLTFGQSPAWVNDNIRRLQYPDETFYTGFTYNLIEQGKSLQEFVERTKTDAQAELVKKIRLRIEAKVQSNVYTQNVNGKYNEIESYNSEAATSSDAEVVGIKTESYYDKSANVVYAFAYVNRLELIGYYKGNLSMNIAQVEGLLQTAQNLEESGEKAKARKQLEAVKPLFAKIRYAQDLLTAVDVNSTSADLQQVKTETLYNTLTQMQARLAQAVYVYVESDENLFGQKVNVVANQLKAALAKSGCSFVDEVENADFRLSIDVSIRQSSSDGDLIFCYADTQVELYDIRKQKVVYSDEIAQKAGGVSKDKAGRKAMTDVVPKISEKLKPWIE